MYVVEGYKNAEQICSTIVTKTTKQAKVGRFGKFLHKKSCSVRNIKYLFSFFTEILRFISQFNVSILKQWLQKKKKIEI